MLDSESHNTYNIRCNQKYAMKADKNKTASEAGIADHSAGEPECMVDVVVRVMGSCLSRYIVFFFLRFLLCCF